MAELYTHAVVVHGDEGGKQGLATNAGLAGTNDTINGNLWQRIMCEMASFVSKECGTGQPEFVTSGDDGALPGVVRSDGHACEHFRQQHP